MAHFTPINIPSSPPVLETLLPMPQILDPVATSAPLTTAEIRLELESMLPRILKSRVPKKLQTPSRSGSEYELPNGDSDFEADSEPDEEMSEDPETEVEASHTSETEIEDTDNESDLERRLIVDILMDEDEDISDIDDDTEPSSSIIESEIRPTTTHLQVPQLSFKDLQRQRQQILNGSKKYESIYTPPKPTLSSSAIKPPNLRSNLLNLRLKIDSLERQKSRIESEIENCENAIEDTKSQIITQQISILLAHNGLSTQLMTEFEKFRSMIEPEKGFRNGFSITCFGDHKGEYVRYDPSLQLFKETVEGGYENCFWRCEASTVDGWNAETQEAQKEFVVEFWPIAAPIIQSGNKLTWGELFPLLYELAWQAADTGSVAAMDMLRALPGEEFSACGGWLFDYEFDPAMKNHAIIAKRWRFRGSYLI